MRDIPDQAGLEGLDRAIDGAARALLLQQQRDGHWVFELEADATIPAEYILLRQYLGEPDAPQLEAAMGRYLRRTQGPHGGWPLFHGGPADISATVKAYFALKMTGDDPAAAHMARARDAILERGGAARANAFTRILLTQFGELPWGDTPIPPVEMVLLPRAFPVHLSRMACWARAVLVPLLVLQAFRVRARNPRGVRIPELFTDAAARVPMPQAGRHPVWMAFFHALQGGLNASAPVWSPALRPQAIEWCRRFVVERLNGDHGPGAIYPAMANAAMMFDALGCPPDHPDRAAVRRAIEGLVVHRGDEAYCQPCVSPVWDTALACHALMEAGGADARQAAGRGLAWLAPRQELEVRGDWAERRPGVRPGGWAFQYRNPHYPDLDDTAVVVMAMDRARRHGAAGFDQAIARGAEWTVGLQSRNGGWGAFDADNVDDYLNCIPFADHGALLDPPTADVTARCVGMLAQLGHAAEEPAMRTALAFLLREQRSDGSWFGRWGVNHVYGTWSALSALHAAGLDATHPAVQRAAAWLQATQNGDGGWGEDCASYEPGYLRHAPVPSTASQTAWALLGLMAAGAVGHPAVSAGIAYLLRTQEQTGLWAEEAHTGGGFPRAFYLRYHGYPKYFPLWALARYRNLRPGRNGRAAPGI
ncbi:squalene-hopene cyclase [Allostella vacuolata]|nr:squalene-hopene cyclase [Stella vacuolata]